MSFPATPSSPGQPMLTPAELQHFEAPLIALANLSGGDLRKLFYAFFSFLNRRTDFYCILPDDGSGASGRNMGFKEGQAEQILIASFRQFPLRRVGNKKAPPQKHDGAPSASNSVAADAPSAKVEVAESPKTITSTTSPSSEEVKAVQPASDEATTKSDNSNSETVDTNKAVATITSKPKKDEANKNTIRYTDEGKQVPVGNGGSATRYVWTQTLEEVTIHIPLPEGTRAKDLNVDIAASTLSIHQTDAAFAKSDAAAVAGVGGGGVSPSSFVPLEGTLFGKVRPAECTWTLESTKSINNDETHNMTTLQLTLDKIQKTWWSTVLSGDPIIDTTMVDSTRHIDTYDEKTQVQIRRIMFDQRQEQLGLPSSDKIMGEERSVSSGGDGGSKVPTLPSGVEYIDGETLDKASMTKKE